MNTLFPLALLLQTGCLLGPKKPMPDLMIYAKSFAQEPEELQQDVLLITDGHIVSRMSAAKADRKYKGGPAKLTADRVSAGLVDAHGHPAGLGRAMTELNLNQTTTFAQVLQHIEAQAEQLPNDEPDRWLVGRGWDQNDWNDAPSGGWPTAAHLDAIDASRPIAIRRIDGHALWVNSKAMSLASINSSTQDPQGGWIFRDDSGEPTGILLDDAMDLIPVPGPSVSEQKEHLKVAFRALMETGLTGVHAMGVTDSAMQALYDLNGQGELPLRVWAYASVGSKAAQQLLLDGPQHTEHLKVIGIKAFADGALGSRGALLSQDYADTPEHKGLALTSEDELTDLASRCLQAEVQLAVHAIGDAAVTMVLNAFVRTRAQVPDKHHIPLRIEHAQVVTPKDRPRFSENNIIASMQPIHAVSDGPWAAQRLGPERMPWAYAFKALQQSGATLAFGSDFPVEDHNPLLGLEAATHRGCEPGFCLSTHDALHAFTAGAAQATGQVGQAATLSIGSRADITLWESHEQGAFPFRPVATILGGSVVWSAR